MLPILLLILPCFSSSLPLSYVLPKNVFVPPDIQYWAKGVVNSTVYDSLGLPWYCFTNMQTHCLPLFPVPEDFQTTRRPFQKPWVKVLDLETAKMIAEGYAKGSDDIVPDEYGEATTLTPSRDVTTSGISRENETAKKNDSTTRKSEEKSSSAQDPENFLKRQNDVIRTQKEPRNFVANENDVIVLNDRFDQHSNDPSERVRSAESRLNQSVTTDDLHLVRNQSFLLTDFNNATQESSNESSSEVNPHKLTISEGGQEEVDKSGLVRRVDGHETQMRSKVALDVDTVGGEDKMERQMKELSDELFPSTETSSQKYDPFFKNQVRDKENGSILSTATSSNDSDVSKVSSIANTTTSSFRSAHADPRKIDKGEENRILEGTILNSSNHDSKEIEDKTEQTSLPPSQEDQLATVLWRQLVVDSLSGTEDVSVVKAENFSDEDVRSEDANNDQLVKLDNATTKDSLSSSSVDSHCKSCHLALGVNVTQYDDFNQTSIMLPGDQGFWDQNIDLILPLPTGQYEGEPSSTPLTESTGTTLSGTGSETSSSTLASTGESTGTTLTGSEISSSTVAATGESTGTGSETTSESSTSSTLSSTVTIATGTEHGTGGAGQTATSNETESNSTEQSGTRTTSVTSISSTTENTAETSMTSSEGTGVTSTTEGTAGNATNNATGGILIPVTGITTEGGAGMTSSSTNETSVTSPTTESGKTSTSETGITSSTTESGFASSSETGITSTESGITSTSESGSTSASAGTGVTTSDITKETSTNATSSKNETEIIIPITTGTETSTTSTSEVTGTTSSTPNTASTTETPTPTSETTGTLAPSTSSTNETTSTGEGGVITSNGNKTEVTSTTEAGTGLANETTIIGGITSEKTETGQTETSTGTSSTETSTTNGTGTNGTNVIIGGTETGTTSATVTTAITSSTTEATETSSTSESTSTSEGTTTSTTTSSTGEHVIIFPINNHGESNETTARNESIGTITSPLPSSTTTETTANSSTEASITTVTQIIVTSTATEIINVLNNESSPIKAYTIFGEACKDECAKRGYSYTWCNKVSSSKVGTWADSDYCTTDSNVTTYGEECVDECEQRGYSYFWCHKSTNLWGYCTPQSMLDKLNASQSSGKSSHGPKTLAYTAFGEECRDECEKKDGSAYTWCTKTVQTEKGTWPHKDFCTTSPNITSTGHPCLDDCLERGFGYFWCHTVGDFGYCTPGHLLAKLDTKTAEGSTAKEPTTTAGHTTATEEGSLSSSTTEHGSTTEAIFQTSHSASTTQGLSTEGTTTSSSTEGGSELYIPLSKNTSTTSESTTETPHSSTHIQTAEGSTTTTTSTEGASDLYRPISNLTTVRSSTSEATTQTPHSTSTSKINETASSSTHQPNIQNSTTAVHLLPVEEASSPQTTSHPSPTSEVLAYTVFGEPCKSTCARHNGESYTWCVKVEGSRVGTWWGSDYCTTDPGLTPKGETCLDACEDRGYDYYWCHKEVRWDYCTPQHLIVNGTVASSAEI